MVDLHQASKRPISPGGKLAGRTSSGSCLASRRSTAPLYLPGHAAGHQQLKILGCMLNVPLRPKQVKPDQPDDGAGQHNQAIAAPHWPIQAVPSWIDSMVMAKPIEFWKARALPTISGVQALADMAEKCGESATTVAPEEEQERFDPAGASTSKGNSAQHIAERASAVAATRALPMR